MVHGDLRLLLHLTAFTTLRALRTARHGAGLHLSALSLFNLALLGMSTDVMDCIATLFSRVLPFSVFHIMLDGLRLAWLHLSWFMENLRFLLHLTAFTTPRALRVARHGTGWHFSVPFLFNLGLPGQPS